MVIPLTAFFAGLSAGFIDKFFGTHKIIRNVDKLIESPVEEKKDEMLSETKLEIISHESLPVVSLAASSASLVQEKAGHKPALSKQGGPKNDADASDEHQALLSAQGSFLDI